MAAVESVRCGEAYGSHQPPPSVLQKHQPYASRRGAGKRCPARIRPQCCGRGEAAGDCVDTAGAFSTATADRVPHVLGTRYAAAPEFLLRLGSAGRTEQDYKTRKQCYGEHSRGRAASPWPTAASSPTSPSEQPEPAAREDLVDLRRGRTPGATAGCHRGVFPSGFPRHVADLGPIHHFTVIPTAGGAASAAAAKPRIAAAGGAASHDRKGANRGRTSTDTGTLRRRCARLRTLG